jgi:tetratricopeptide (TPR) repeat protein
MNRFRFQGKAAWPGLLLVLATVVLYWPAVGFDFTCFDDPEYVTQNTVVQGGLTWAGLKWALVSTSSAMWHPVTWVAHLTTWELFGPASGKHHLVNILLHALNSLLLFLLLRKLTGATTRSAFAAALFAWHPLRVESVAWVAELKDVLAMLFWLLTTWAYARWVQSGRESARLTMIGLYALGLMTKPMLVTLPFALLLLDVWPLKRLTWPAGWSRRAPPETGSDTAQPAPPGSIGLRNALLEKLQLLGLAAAFSAITLVTTRGGTPVAELPVWDRLANAFVSYARYLGNTFHPEGLAVLYPHPGKWPLWQVALSAGLLLGLSGLAFLAARRRPYLFTGWFWFVGTLVPVIGLVQAGPQALADRFTYVPSIGLTVAIVWGTAEPARRLPFGRWSAVAAGLVLAAGCMAGTRLQLAHWRNSITLFQRALAVTTDNAIANYNLAQTLSVAGRVPEAIPLYEEAIRVDPQYDSAHNNLGLSHAVLGSHQKAIPHYREALRINPDNSGACFNLGQALLKLGQVDEAIRHFTETIRLTPQHPWASFWLGRAKLEQGRLDDAIGSFSKAVALNPRSYEARYELGAALLASGGADTAIAQLRAAIQLKPDFAEAHARLGLALASKGQARDAIPAYRRALDLQPDAVEPLNNLAWMLATHPAAALRDGAEAVRLAAHACQITSNQVPRLLGTLAAAYAEAARFDEAQQTARRALELAATLGQQDVVASNRELLQKFQRAMPHRTE